MRLNVSFDQSYLVKHKKSIITIDWSRYGKQRFFANYATATTQPITLDTEPKPAAIFGGGKMM